TELLQYGYIGVGLHSVRLAFWRQDAIALLSGVALFSLIIAVRHGLGFGNPLGGIGLKMVAS
ncbi:MAG: hypothetical protein K2P68_06785, partial [Sphingomonas sp.]|nr:hypothetical protein [Sphingomonas sp.]MBY0582610.1 hypothetical protein [Sphingomonas sp.]